jgi:hypothetical protein
MPLSGRRGLIAAMAEVLTQRLIAVVNDLARFQVYDHFEVAIIGPVDDAPYHHRPAVLVVLVPLNDFEFVLSSSPALVMVRALAEHEPLACLDLLAGQRYGFVVAGFPEAPEQRERQEDEGELGERAHDLKHSNAKQLRRACQL